MNDQFTRSEELGRRRHRSPPIYDPMQARLGLVDDPLRYALEFKWDGIRALAYVVDGRLTLRSRTGQIVTHQYPELGGLADAVGKNAVLDGEIIALGDDGKPSFERLQTRFSTLKAPEISKRVATTPVAFMIFDVLWIGEERLLDLPYLQRRAALASLGLNNDQWQVPAHHLVQPRQILEVSALHGLEGIVAKRLDSPYQPGKRSGAWIKMKHVRRQEFVIGGYHSDRSGTVRSLIVGYYDRTGRLIVAGKVGTGFSRQAILELTGILSTLRCDRAPFFGVNTSFARWVRPQAVCEIEFSSWTHYGHLRHPSFKGLRTDKDPRAVVREDSALNPK